MDIERAHAEQASKPDRLYATLRGDYDVLRGGAGTGMSGRQPAVDGTLYWKIGNPRCVFSAQPHPFPG